MLKTEYYFKKKLGFPGFFCLCRKIYYRRETSYYKRNIIACFNFTKGEKEMDKTIISVSENKDPGWKRMELGHDYSVRGFLKRCRKTGGGNAYEPDSQPQS